MENGRTYFGLGVEAGTLYFELGDFVVCDNDLHRELGGFECELLG